MKKIAGALIVLLVVMVGASVAAHMLIDQAALRRNVVAALHHQTGLTLQMERSTIQLLPWPSFEAGNVVMVNDGQKPLLTARSVHAGISMFALLHREVRLQDFVVDGARLSLLRNADGQYNWSLTPAPSAQSVNLPVPTRAGERVDAHWDISVDALHLTNSSVEWKDSVSGLSGGFDVRLLDLAGLRSPSPWISLQGAHGGTPFTMQGHVGTLALLRDGSLPWTFSLGTTLGTEPRRDWLNVDGQIRDARHLHGISLTLQGEWPSLRDAHRLFPNAGLPDVQGIGGLLTIEDDVGPVNVSFRSVPEVFRALVHGIRPTRVHLHVGQAALREGVYLSNVHLDADGPAAEFAVGSDVSWKNAAWRVQGSAGTLEQSTAAWQSHLQSALPVAFEIRSQNLTLSSALNFSNSTPPTNAQDGAVFHLAGTVGAQSSHLTLEGGAHILHLPGALLNDVSLKSVADTTGLKDVHLSGLSLRSKEASVDGELAAVQSGDSPPLITGQIHAAVLDLDALQGLWQKQPTSATTSKPVMLPGMAGQAEKIVAPSGTPSPEARNPHHDSGLLSGGAPGESSLLVRRLQAQDMDLHLSIDQAHFYGHDYTDLKTHLTLSGGHLRLVPISGQGQGTNMSGELDLDAGAQPVKAVMLFQPLILPSGLMERLLGLPALLSGPVQAVGALTGEGDSIEALQKTLKGHLGLSVVDGNMDGKILAGLAGPGAASLLGDGSRPLRCMGIHMTLGDGTALIDTFGLQSGRFSTAGTGQLSLETKDVILHLVPSVDFAGAGASASVLVTGRLPDLHAQQARDGTGSFNLTIGGAPPADPCGTALNAAREGLPGPAVPAQTQHHSHASDILRALGVLH
ncbi:AsmA family protein [Gluconobacter wancherniae]|uniref:AsmA family protein n=1 Tax=Gluconobacter wancherniae TaxID=1307955 RepID=UPI001B8D17C8|nr:AsmA family protein [Gluconobacter wancherniae]MBS1087606.1 AsmA family protein [Gluconobacter wancherniae]